MNDLLPLVMALSEIAGPPQSRLAMAGNLANSGLVAFGEHDDGRTLALRRRAQATSVVDTERVVNLFRADEAIIVALLHEGMAEPPATSSSEPRPLFTKPSGQLEAQQRLDLMVSDVTSEAKTELRIGSGSWNDEEIQHLLSVVESAIHRRAVLSTIYSHDYDNRHGDHLIESTSRIGPSPPLKVTWYHGSPSSLTHAKFAVNSFARGDLGTANTTSRDLQDHVDVGMEGSSNAAHELTTFLATLMSRGVLL